MLLRKLAIVAALSLTVSGCYVRARAHVRAPAVRVVEVDDYEPEYYDDNVVYYDDGGAPYYYVGGRVVFIERSHPHYSRYRTHWSTHRDVYSRWHARHRSSRYYRRGQWKPRVRVRGRIGR